jgi:hypothetical protein
MIPTTIHQYRDGPDIARHSDGWGSSWISRHPSWNYILWSRAEARKLLATEFGPVVAECFDRCEWPTTRALLFSSGVLLCQGGFFVARELECLRPLDGLLDSQADTVIGPATAGQSLEELVSSLADGIFAARKGAHCAGRTFAAVLGAIAKGEPVRQVWSHVYQTDGQPEKSVPFSAIDPKLFRELVRPRAAADTRSRPDKVTARRNGQTLTQQHSVLQRPPLRWAGFLFLGHPRCGSLALSKMLQTAGLRVGYEGPGPDGSVSWWHTGRHIANSRWPSFAHGAHETREIWLAGRIFHYLRDPCEAIPSIVLENEIKARNNNSFRMRRAILRRRFGIDLAGLDAATAAATSYALWNRIAETLATDGRVFVEHPVIDCLPPSIGPIPLLRRNDSRRKFGKTKPELDIADAIRRSPEEARPLLEHYLALYSSRT